MIRNENMPAMIWIDAIEFQEYGGWKKDTQFTHLMGSAYLLACDIPGKPVENARMAVYVPQNGMYRIWTRAKNWYAPYAPGKFTVAVDGKRAAAVLGAAPSRRWVWQIADNFFLEKGEHVLELIDLTGYMGRCSTLLLTTDMDYLPQSDIAAFEKERARLKRLPNMPTNGGNYDVIVVGGGPGGTASAIMAARGGAKTLLLQDRPILGGNASTEAGIGYNGASSQQFNAREGGIVEEIIRRKTNKQMSWTQTLMQMCSEETNLTVFCNQRVLSVDVENMQIRSLTARHTENGTYTTFYGKVFLDCTGDSELAYQAGAKIRCGREAKWQYHEAFAPQTPDTCTMSGCLWGTRFVDTGIPQEYLAPEWVPRFPKGKKFGRNIVGIYPDWWLEAPNDIDDIYDAEEARDELYRIILGYFNYLKNDWEEKERATTYAIGPMKWIDAKRESRRIIGDYVLNQNDCVQGTKFQDTIAYAGWPIDLHNLKGIYSGEEGPFFSNAHVPLVSIPYRCIYSKNISNLMMAGRNISVSHIALGTTRVQATIASIGQACGTAAAMCVKKHLTPKALGEQCLEELRQQLLKDDQYIPGLRNADPLDLARKAKITASSVSREEVYVQEIGVRDAWLPLNCTRGSFLPRRERTQIQELYLMLKNETSRAIDVQLSVREQIAQDVSYVSDTSVMDVQRVPAGYQGWIAFHVPMTLRGNGIWAVLEPVEGIKWRVLKMAPIDCTRSVWDAKWRRFPTIPNECHMVAFEKPVEKTANCEAGNIINGYSRAVSSEDYCWVSDSNQKLPQWIELEFEQPVTLNLIQITFDTDMTNPSMLNGAEKIPSKVVTDYSVEIDDGIGWITIAKVAGNYLRQKRHKFKKHIVKKVRITVYDTGNHGSARIFEIRCYCE